MWRWEEPTESASVCVRLSWWTSLLHIGPYSSAYRTLEHQDTLGGTAGYGISRTTVAEADQEPDWCSRGMARAKGIRMGIDGLIYARTGYMWMDCAPSGRITLPLPIFVCVGVFQVWLWTSNAKVIPFKIPQNSTWSKLHLPWLYRQMDQKWPGIYLLAFDTFYIRWNLNSHMSSRMEANMLKPQLQFLSSDSPGQCRDSFAGCLANSDKAFSLQQKSMSPGNLHICAANSTMLWNRYRNHRF